MTQGEIVSGLMAAAGAALLVLSLARQASSRLAKGRARSALIEALMMAAGLALLLVHRLDPTALPRVLAPVKAAMVASIVAQRSRR